MAFVSRPSPRKSGLRSRLARSIFGSGPTTTR